MDDMNENMGPIDAENSVVEPVADGADTADASPGQDNADIDAVDIKDETVPDEDKAFISDFGGLISDTIVEALTELYGKDQAGQICSEIAQEARDSDTPIQDIIAERVSELSGIDLPDTGVDIPSLDDALPDTLISRYEELKDRYDADKDKYLFRNTFVVLERLELNIEAYKTGEDGDKGRPVSGGDIAMNIIELTRSNVWDSMLEIAVRNYFDEHYPAKVEAGTTVEETADMEPPQKDDRQGRCQ